MARAEIKRYFIETMAEQVAGLLRQRIINGEFAPGTQLLPAVLGVEYNISRRTAARALGLLRTAELVTIQDSRGSFVTFTE